MNRQSVSLKRQGQSRPNYFSREASYKRRLVRALTAWPTAEALAIDMALREEPIERDERTWARYRSGQTTPEPWLCEILFEMSVEQTRQQIRALEQRLEAIGAER